MAGQRYPLEALRKLRDERAEAQAHRLAAQVARAQAAEAKLRELERARREQAARVAETLRQEHARVAEGGVGGLDLLRLTEFETAARAQAAALERAEGESRQVLTRERAEEQRLRQELSAREAEAKLVRNHEASFHEENAEQQHRAEEEAALEQWNARRH